MFKYIFCRKDGTVFDEGTSETIHDDVIYPDEIREKITKCAINGARLLGLEPRKEDLDKYGISI